MDKENLIEVVHKDYDIIIDVEQYVIAVDQSPNIDYEYCANIPKINGVKIIGDVSPEKLNLATLDDLQKKENLENKIIDINENSNDSQYPSAKCVYTKLNNKANLSLSNLNTEGQAKFDEKANVSLSNLDAIGQAKFDEKADISLSNLDEAGQAKFDEKADISLSNLDEAGQAKFDEKADISLSNLDETAKAKFDEKADISLSNLDAIGQAKFDEKADISLSNLDEAGQAKFDEKANKIDVLEKTEITNCILNIPQRLKLELNASKALVLKAGSQIIVPNGFEADGTTKKFDYITVDTDIQQGNGHAAQDLYFVRNYSSPKYLIGYHATKCFSGNTAPTGFGTYAFWYDTSNNLVKWTQNSGATWTSGYSLPVGLTTGSSATVISSIDQIFNGFGFIGSTVFADKGIKGVIPNGRNEDGSLNNIEYITSKVELTTRMLTNRTNYYFVGLTFGNIIDKQYYTSNTARIAPSETFIFNTIDNYIYDTDGNIIKMLCVGNSNTDTTRITNFEQKTSFRIVDYNEIAGIKAYIKDTYINGTSWYRIWSDGWIEQGGYNTTTNSKGTTNLLKSFSNTNYSILLSTFIASTTDDNGTSTAAFGCNLTSSSFGYSKSSAESFIWYACGY